MTKALLLIAGLLAAGAMLLGPVLLGLVGILFGAAANAAANPCVSPIGVVAPAGGPIRLPVVGQFQVTSEYGMRHNPGDIDTGQYRMHSGLDLAEIPGEGPIVAPMAGVVQSTPTSATGNNQVYLDHGGGLVTGYMHLSSRTVSVGEQVWSGKQIGVEGDTGNSSGSHLHFEVHVSGQKLNPRTWLTEQGLSVPAKGVAATAPGVAAAAPPEAEDPPEPTSILASSPPAPTPTPLNPTDTPGSTQPVTTGLPEQVGPYQGEQVVNAGLIIQAGQAMNLDAWTITVGVMTAMGESSLVNIGHGDAVGPDSRGLFQQRANDAWGSLPDRMNPTIASTNFFTALIAVPGYRDLAPTIAAHSAQNNADPYHYEPSWPDAALMVATLTEDPSLLESLPAGGLVTGCEDGSPPEAPPAGDGSGAAIVAAARHYLGTPYSWGGGNTSGPSLGSYTSPSLDGTSTVGFDCSGLVLLAVHNATGVQLPHSAEAQGTDPRGTTIPRDWALLQPGDVISFSQDGSGAPGSFGHVGIYLGDEQMIHAPRPGRSVEIVQLRGSSYYEPMVWSIKRYASS